MVALLWIASIFCLIYSLLCYIRARKIERRAMLILEKLDRKNNLERRFRGKQNRPFTLNQPTRRTTPTTKPARFI